MAEDDGASTAEADEAQLLRDSLRQLHECQSRLAAAYQCFDVAQAAAEGRLPRAVIQSWHLGEDITIDGAKPGDDSDLSDQSDRLCVICITALEAHEGGVRLPCGHLFHESCVAEWLRKKSSCPHCRAQLFD